MQLAIRLRCHICSRSQTVWTSTGNWAKSRSRLQISHACSISSTLMASGKGSWVAKYTSCCWGNLVSELKVPPTAPTPPPLRRATHPHYAIHESPAPHTPPLTESDRSTLRNGFPRSTRLSGHPPFSTSPQHPPARPRAPLSAHYPTPTYTHRPLNTFVYPFPARRYVVGPSYGYLSADCFGTPSPH